MNTSGGDRGPPVLRDKTALYRLIKIMQSVIINQNLSIWLWKWSAVAARLTFRCCLYNISYNVINNAGMYSERILWLLLLLLSSSLLLLVVWWWLWWLWTSSLLSVYFWTLNAPWRQNLKTTKKWRQWFISQLFSFSEIQSNIYADNSVGGRKRVI